MEALSGQSPRASGRAAGGALVLVGFMGAGKTSSAVSIAGKLGVDPVDADEELARELGEPIEAFFEREGEPAFRNREQDLVLRLLARDDVEVLALGGGAVGSQSIRRALADHTVVHLDVSPRDAWRRVSASGRPLARSRLEFERLYAEREGLYREVADAELPARRRSIAAAALPALLALRVARGEGLRPRMIWARSVSGDYPAFIGRGLLAGGFFFPEEGRARFAVTDETVRRHHSIAADRVIAIPAGEEHKTLSTLEGVLRDLARAGATREDVVAAVGGGVVGDLAGFAAAVYQRGMAYVQVPTTLVGQVDSAYGGKTGVDLPEGKNYAGAYHQPRAVVCDPQTLSTLPAQELAAGWAEVVKTALIAGDELWERVRAGGPVDDETIAGCVRTKLGVVAADERDAGRRQVLNLGHTVGHAIEAATGYARYRHGEAVAIGLLAALRLSGDAQLRDEVEALLAGAGLPTRFEGVTVEDVVALTERDKKRTGGKVPFVLVERVGRVTHGNEVSPQDLRKAVEEVRA